METAEKNLQPEGRKEDYTYGLKLEHERVRVPYDMQEMHSHNYHEIYFLLSGARRYFIGHTIYPVLPGDFVIIPRYELHRTTRSHSSGFDRYLVNFSDEYTAQLRRAAGNENFERLLHAGCITLPAAQIERVQSLFAKMERELADRDAYSLLLAAGTLNEILAAALRHGAAKLCEPEKTADQIQKVARYVSENYQNAITLHDAAQMAYMEDTYFSKQFKRLTGFGFVEYLTQTRIKAACDLLRSTKLSVSKISERCGFSGSNYFGDVFRRLNGMSPLAYRCRTEQHAGEPPQT